MSTLNIFAETETKDLINYISQKADLTRPLFLWIDLFCGCGGVTEGYSRVKNNFVVACVNHDDSAIKSHHLNHPECIHYTEDIRNWRVIVKLKHLVTQLRLVFPDMVLCLHASLECTHFSKAKGGMSRDADSRTLAEHLFNYDCLGIQYITIENVQEFTTWGPLNDDGKPIKSKQGQDYKAWINNYKKLGYTYQSMILNAADYGAYTSRKRYFAILAKAGLPVAFPERTHAPKKELSKYPNLLPHNPVKEMLDLEDEGQSLFEKNKSGNYYVTATFSRVYYGLLKFHKEGLFRIRYNGGDMREKSKSLNKPLGTILCNSTHSIVKPIFLTSYYGASQDGNGVHSLESACPTITTKDRFVLHHLQYCYGKPYYSKIDEPSGTLTTTPKGELVTTKWLFDMQFSNVGSSINRTAPTIIARQDKKPLYLASANNYGWIDYSQPHPDDCDVKKQLKEFMRQHGIIDIKIRPLKVEELKRIQGFPEEYKLVRGKTKAKKQIGNAVVPVQAMANAQALYDVYCEISGLA